MQQQLERIGRFRWRLPATGAMRVDGLIYASEDLASEGGIDEPARQVANVATLPGIVGHAIAMPDIHWGYGFPIGGVAAFDLDEGVVSPGGVGYDINCGVRMLATILDAEEISSRVPDLAEALYRRVPAGLGSARRDLKLSEKELERVLTEGARWASARGFGVGDDLERLEEGGCLEGAVPDHLSSRARERGRGQLGTLGSGNHFLEVQVVDEVFDEAAASAMGLVRGRVAITIHSGSRGLGYQVCDDFIKLMLDASRKYGIELPDRQLCCAPIGSPEGQRYLGAMYAAANFAFANRQLMAHQVRLALEEELGWAPARHGLSTVYDVCHNIAKIERRRVQEDERELCVHRKGATRALPPGDHELPDQYRDVGQPVLIPGDMGRYSFVLAGRAGSEEAFCSSCHGAGRQMSRSAARKAAGRRDVTSELASSGIILRATGRRTVLEEISEAYKDVAEVVEAVDGAGLAGRVARLRPLAVIKG
jgi:tRNA-splicing ligase RtcB